MSFSLLVINNHGQLLYRGLYGRKIAMPVSRSVCLCNNFKLCECVWFCGFEECDNGVWRTPCVTLRSTDRRWHSAVWERIKWGCLKRVKETNSGIRDKERKKKRTTLVSWNRKSKVKCTLVQELKLCTGHMAHRGSRGIALLYVIQQVQLYVVNFIPLLSSLYMFRAAHTPIIRSTKFNCIYSHWYNHRLA